MISSSAKDYKTGDQIKTKKGELGTVLGVVSNRYIEAKIDGTSLHDGVNIFIPAHGDCELYYKKGEI